MASLAGSLGAALAAMVANLSTAKGGFEDRYDELAGIAEKAQSVKDALVRGVDADTQAFDRVIEAMRMPKDTEQEREERARAMLEGYKEATRVPLGTVEQCRDALELCAGMAAMADPEMVSDVGSGALMAQAGAHAAGYNVLINLRHIDDEAFGAEMRSRVKELLEECDRLTAAVRADVERVLE